jgi:uncharacterized protein (DUF2235 family)
MLIMKPGNKRLVLCFDGTWNAVMDPKTVTNVVRLANLVTVSDDKDVPQITYYNSGVGSGGLIDRFIGGAFGAGLKANVKRGISFLALNYEKGDEIYLFGFSRGAYTARAVAGVLGTGGIPLDISETEDHWNLYQQMAKLKDQRGHYGPNSKKRAPYDTEINDLQDKLDKITRYKGKDLPIRCVGVWDTVGAYGIPSGFANGIIPRFFTYWTRGFRDTRIGAKVDVGLHAIAIDEMRKPFVPTFWTLRVDRDLGDQKVEQVWFPGVHSNIGGGYDTSGLSDVALAWMISRVETLTDLRFNREEVLKTVWPCTAATLYRSSKGGAFTGLRNILPGDYSLVRSRLQRLYRWLTGRETNVEIRRINEKLHWSVPERCGWPTALVDGLGQRKYAPANLHKAPKEVVDPTPLERDLLDRNRDWKSHCQFGDDCVCAKRGASAAPSSERPSEAA